MNFRSIFYVNGLLLMMMAIAMIVPMAVDLAYGHSDWKAFLIAITVTFFFGGALIAINHEKSFTMNTREVFVLTTFSFIFTTAFAALPFCFADVALSYSKAFFEAMSGVTTTGSTVIVGLDSMPPGILLWRAMLHWLGGIGFVVIALAVLPMLRISGMQLYKSQAFGGSVEKVLPSAGQLALHLCGVYILLTALCAGLFKGAGMNWFEAICHGMSALSTGGFSTSDSSLGYFKNPHIEYIAIVFMIAGGLPFVHYLKLMRGHFSFPGDSQVRAALLIIGTLVLVMTLYLLTTGNYSGLDAFRQAAFMIVTLITTTGFATSDYTTWGSFAICIAFLTTTLGLCSGSTAGGLKTFRLQLMMLTLYQQLKQLISPNGVFSIRYNGKNVDQDIKSATIGFFFVYIAVWFICSVLLSLTGLDFETAISGALTAVANVGPGVGSTIGPAGNFSTLPESALWVLNFAMLLGRLEFMTVLVLMTPFFWRR